LPGGVTNLRTEKNRPAVIARTACGAAAVALVLGLPSAAMAQISDMLSQKSSEAAEIVSLAQRDGNVRVIVRFASPVPSSGVKPDPASIAAVKARVAASQGAVIAAHFGSPAAPRPGQGFERGLTRFEITPGFATNVTPAELEALAADPSVVSIQYDRPIPLALIESVPLIGMPTAHAAGATGAGYAIAVLDTGVQANHEFLAGKVVAEACFSNAVPGGSRASLCPNGTQSQTGPGSANAETAQCINGSTNLCQHGTHVAGIAAGFNTNPQPGVEPPNGVARNGSIFAIQVFTRFNSSADCSPSAPPCVASWTSNQIQALDHVFANLNLAGGVKVAAVNMSLGGGPNTAGTCDGDPQAPSINNLRAAGVLTAIAAGNDGSRTQISHPGCISTATTVASSTKSDAISPFSNMSAVVDLVAPGSSIQSSVPVVPSSTTTYSFFNGTSMATPHAAGAIAAIRAACPTATANAIEAALKNTGTPITDNRSGGTQTKPRIRVDLAVQNLNCSAPPAPPPMCTLASQLGDFNGDGKSDLLFRRDGDGVIFQYQMNGFQIVAVQQVGVIGLDWVLIAVADFDGDGKSDLLFRRTDGTLAIYLVNGAQVVGSQVLGALGLDFDFVGAEDFNGDGKADMLFRRKSDGMLVLYQMNGFQIVAAQLLGAIGTDWHARGVRDFNGDGKADMLFRRASDGMLALYLMNGFQVVAAQLLGAVGTDWELVGVRDFNGDNRADILARKSDGMLLLYLMDGFQILGAQLLGSTGPDFVLLGLGDFNGDGRSDMVLRRTSDGMLSAYLMNGFQIVAAQLLGAIGTDWNSCYSQPPLAVAQAGL
jgi:subtilisin family serine protease